MRLKSAANYKQARLTKRQRDNRDKQRQRQTDKERERETDIRKRLTESEWNCGRRAAVAVAIRSRYSIFATAFWQHQKLKTKIKRIINTAATTTTKTVKIIINKSKRRDYNK